MAVIRDRYELEIDTKGAVNGISSLNGSMKTMAAAGGAAAAAAVVKLTQAMIDAGSTYQNYENQLRLVTGSQQELEATMAKLTTVSQNNRVAFGDSVELYSKLSTATRDMGVSQDEVLAVMSKFQQALQISGADANTAAGAIRQFGQAMGSGQVKGDELVSIIEAMGPALNIMAQESGLTIPKLREMAAEGELTSEVFFEMLQNSDALSASFNKMGGTAEQAGQQFQDSFTYALAALSEATGATAGYQSALESLTRTMDDWSGREGALVNIEDSNEIFEKAKEGVISYDAAIKELQTRLMNSPGLMLPGVGFVFDEDEARANALREQVEELKNIKAAQEEAARSAEVLAEHNTNMASLDEARRTAMEAHNAALQTGNEATTVANEEEAKRVVLTEEEIAAQTALVEQLTLKQARMEEEAVILQQAIDSYGGYNNMIDLSTQGQTNNNMVLDEAIINLQELMVSLDNVAVSQNNYTNQVASSIDATYAAIDAETQRIGVLQELAAAQSAASSYSAPAMDDWSTGTGSVATQPPGPLYNEPFIGARALGGKVTKGRGYVVNENQQELFYPNQSGSVVPMSKSNQGVNINFTINATDTVGFDNYLNKRRGDIVNLVRQAMQEQNGR